VKRIFIILLIFAVMLMAVACGGSTPNAPDNGGDAANEIVYVVDLCYVNNEYVTTGDEDVSALLYYPNHHMFAPEGKQYFTLLDVVLREDQLGVEHIVTMIDDRIQFHSVEVKDRTAFVDIAGEGLSGGSLEEGLLISQIVSALRGSFEEIDRVQFLIDGKVPETLMGHYDTTQPYETGIYSTGL